MASIFTTSVTLLPSRHASTQFSKADLEILKIVQTTIAKQLSIETTVAPTTKFADLDADSLDTVSFFRQFSYDDDDGRSTVACLVNSFKHVEILMALEERFGVSIGETRAENISTVQDAADLIHKVKAADAWDKLIVVFQTNNSEFVSQTNFE
ncbi:hypothetical protein L2E82_27770 [Cichorium intybus]|uniref:Uncharacterized protein n=1 Tax=Cichorium intybus TaxID=13427 RepID=A0ACB9CU95_CICIN|nr:hypothetical protein L2E82_27770 [Cichorium intybus]